MKLARLALVALAALRLTRFVTTDVLGEWLLVGPAKRWAARDVIAPASSPAEFRQEFAASKAAAIDEHSIDDMDRVIAFGAHGPLASKRARLVKGLDCPFCVGFWLGALVLLGEVVTRRVPPLRGLWSFALAALGLNYVVGHVSSRVDQ